MDKKYTNKHTGKEVEPPKRVTIYLNDETRFKFQAIQDYLGDVGGRLNRQGKNKSATTVMLIDTFYKLFLEIGEEEIFSDRLSRLKKNVTNSDEGQALKSLRRQIDKLLYLELTNFHAITKGEAFDVQELESIHSRFDPTQHELMARIDELIKEDVARGQTIKHSH